MRKFYNSKKICAGCLAFVMTLAVFGTMNSADILKGSASDDSYSKELTSIQKQKDDLDAQIADADKKLSSEKQNLEAINDKYTALEDKIKTVEDYALKLEGDMADLDEKMRDNRYKLDDKTAEIEKDTADFLERIRALYIAGGSDSYANVIGDATDFYDILMRLELVKRVASHDNDELTNLIDEKNEIESLEAELEKQKTDMQEIMKDYATHQKDLAAQKAELLKMQEESGSEISKLQADKNDMEGQADQLSAQYSEISSKAATTTTTTTAKPKATTTKKSSSEGGKNTTTTKKTTQAVTTTPSDNGNDNQTTTAKKTTTAPPKTTSATTTTTSSGSDYGSNQSKIDIVVSYAKSMVGGSYVWGGSSFGATDCSGLVMLSYKQVGIDLPHLAALQATFGIAVSYSNLQPGDLVFFGTTGDIYHVAMYIGNGRIVQAESTATGIVISNLSSFSVYNPIYCMRRLIY